MTHECHSLEREICRLKGLVRQMPTALLPFERILVKARKARSSTQLLEVFLELERLPFPYSTSINAANNALDIGTPFGFGMKRPYIRVIGPRGSHTWLPRPDWIAQGMPQPIWL